MLKAVLFFFLYCTLGAHICPNMEISLDTLSPGVSVESQCVISPPICVIDTFYQEYLLQDLLLKWKESKYVYTGNLQVTGQWDEWDTSYVGDSIPVIVQYRGQKLDVSFLSAYKDSLENQNISLQQIWAYSGTDSITFAPMQDTLFLAFFNGADSTRDFGWTPTVDCIFEPSVYFVIEGRIHKRGNGRMPGVSVSLEDFLEHAYTSIPKTHKNEIKKTSYPLFGFLPNVVGRYNNKYYYLNGKFIPEKDLKNPDSK